MVIKVHGHEYIIDGAGNIVPLTDAAEEYYADLTGAAPSMIRYGRYPSGILTNAYLASSLPGGRRRNWKRLQEFIATMEGAEAALAAEDALLREGERKEKAAREAQIRAEYEAMIAALRLDHPLGDAVEVSTYADPGVRYAKGVRIVTTFARTVDYYGARRHDVHVTAIDGHPVPGDCAEANRATQHLLPTARQKWIGKKPTTAKGNVPEKDKVDTALCFTADLPRNDGESITSNGG